MADVAPLELGIPARRLTINIPLLTELTSMANFSRSLFNAKCQVVMFPLHNNLNASQISFTFSMSEHKQSLFRLRLES